MFTDLYHLFSTKIVNLTIHYPLIVTTVLKVFNFFMVTFRHSQHLAKVSERSWSVLKQKKSAVISPKS